MKESELYEPIKKFLLEKGCTNIYGEVAKTDVLGIKDEMNFIVELKKSLSFKLIDQAIERTKYGHYVYIAIPKRKSGIPKCVKEILLTHKIGLIEVGPRSTKETITVSYNPLANKRNAYKRIRKYIKTYSETQIGGVKSGESITDYAITMDKVKDYMKQHEQEWIPVEDIVLNCETHYKNPKQSLITTLQATWNNSWCEHMSEKRKHYFKWKNQNKVQ